MKQRGETLFVTALVLFSAVALWESYGIAGFSKWSSPGVFPMLASVVMLICGLFIYRDTRTRSDDSLNEHDHGHGHGHGHNHEHSHDNENQVVINAPSDNLADTQPIPTATDAALVLPQRVIVVTVLLALYVTAMPTLGFLLCSGLFLFISISYLWKKPLWLSLCVSLASLFIIHILFRRVFQVILPEGTIISLFS